MTQTLSKTVHSAAWAHKGTAEWPGAAHNPQVLDYFRKAGQPMPDDETPWCAAFVGTMLAECGLQGTGSLAARSYLKWGQKVAPDDAGPGDVVVFWRGGKSGWQGHVAFFHRRAEGRIYVLGGNQGNKVSVAGYAPNRLLGIRRATPPRASAMASTTVQAGAVQLATVARVAAPVAVTGALPSTYALIAGAGVIALAAAWIMRERIKKWAQGIR